MSILWNKKYYVWVKTQPTLLPDRNAIVLGHFSWRTKPLNSPDNPWKGSWEGNTHLASQNVHASVIQFQPFFDWLTFNRFVLTRIYFPANCCMYNASFKSRLTAEALISQACFCSSVFKIKIKLLPSLLLQDKCS